MVFIAVLIVIFTQQVLTNANQDIECSLKCHACKINSEECEVCQENFILQQGQCICPDNYIPYNEQCLKKCESNMYMDFQTLDCKKCKMYDDLCVKECPQNTTFNQVNYKCEEVEYLKLNIIFLVLAGGVFIMIAALAYNYSSTRFSYDALENLKIEQQKEQEQQKINQEIKIQEQLEEKKKEEKLIEFGIKKERIVNENDDADLNVKKVKKKRIVTEDAPIKRKSMRKRASKPNNVNE